MSKKAGKRIALYIGWNRPPVPDDPGKILIHSFSRSANRLVGLILRRGDPLIARAREKEIPVLILPEELCRPRKRIEEALADPGFAPRWKEWLKEFRALKADLGFMFYAAWIPAELYGVPRDGFINFHPGPLPRLRGFEPDTFAILEGLSHVWATFHAVEKDYDTGAILWKTKPVALVKYDTPVSLLARVTRAGLDALPSFLHALANGELVPLEQDSSQASDANRKEAQRESRIDWENDSHDKIDRRARAFNGQKIPIRLKAVIEGRTWRILNIETVAGQFPGKPGELLGRYPDGSIYRDQPIVRTIEGVAVVRVGHCCEEQSPSCIDTGRCARRHLESILPPLPARKEIDPELLRGAIVAVPTTGTAESRKKKKMKTAEKKESSKETVPSKKHKRKPRKK